MPEDRKPEDRKPEDRKPEDRKPEDRKPEDQAPSVLSEVHEHPVTVVETHLDVFGHMNNAVYLQLFEEARWEIITARGYGLATVMKTGIGPTILDIRLQFRRELRNREKIVIKTFVTAIGKKTQSLRQIMVNSKGEDACIADFVLGLFDLSQRRLIEPTPEWSVALGVTQR